jgi:amino-acid N-acetyltransferase
MEIKTAINHRESIEDLLTGEHLPVTDLPATLENFIVALQNNEVVGIAGLEIYEEYGLLRSVAVKPGYRRQGLAAKLILQIEALALSKRLRSVYLLTETATGYFELKGYMQIIRTEVPIELQRSSEFTHSCPQSAIVMKKVL